MRRCGKSLHMALHRAAPRRARRRRRGRPARPHDLLLRRLRGRRLEDDRRRHLLGERLRRLLQDRRGRRDRRRGVRPERHLRRHGRDDDPRQCLARRRRLQIHRRAARPGRMWAWRIRGTSPRSASTRTNPDLVYVAALGHAFGPNKERGVYRSQGRRRDLGADALSATRTPARSTSRWTRTTRASSTPRSGRRSALLEPDQRRAGQRPLQVHRWRRHLDGADAQSRPAEGRHRQDRRRRLARAGGPRLGAGRGGGRRGLPLRRRRRDVAAALASRATCAGAPGTTCTSSPHPTQPETVYVLNGAAWKSTDGGATFVQVPDAARRQPRPLDRPEEPASG